MTDHESRGPREDRAREDYHDPTAGFGGAAPARSALTLRLVLAAYQHANVLGYGVIANTFPKIYIGLSKAG
jgi:hypothetical protein